MTAQQKGRSNRLIAKRNECLIARYYYYGYFKNVCYEEVIRLLAGEFFLSPNRIAAIIQANADMVQAVKQKAMIMHYFQSHWPHLKW